MEISQNELVLVILLLKIGVMACLASFLVILRPFKRFLLTEDRRSREKWEFAVLLGALFSIGVIVRLLVNYGAADLSLSGILLVGLLAGPFAGAVAGCVAGLPAVLSGEILALPMGVLYGLSGGGLRRLCPEKEEIWEFSPFPFMNLYRSFRTALRDRKLDWKLIFFVSCILLEILRIALNRHFGAERIFALSSDSILILMCVLTSTVSCLGIPLKIWNNTRVEILLKEQEAQATRARFDALKSQINPHFLFNTLNSISALIRSDPERARLIVLKLSSILRKLLTSDEDFVPLREELAFIDAYLDIEVIRFGPDKLRIEKRADPRALDAMIPTMILQPIVENAIKHGISTKVNGGTIGIYASQENGRTIIEIEDDGTGVRESGAPGRGIGMHNVDERLKVAFGQEYRFELTSREGAGTQARIEIPDLRALWSRREKDRANTDIDRG